MRRIYQLSIFCLAAGVVNACKPQEVFETTVPPTAGVRFINAVPDTGAMDFRPVDIVENSTFYQVAFRGASSGSVAGYLYKNAQAGTRHFKIFRSPNTADPPDVQIAVASTVVADLDNVSLEAGKRYTFILWGNARGNAPAMKVTLLVDDPPDPTTNVALRIINATGAAIDARAYVTASGPPATATWPNIAALDASGYVNFAPSATITFKAYAAGGALGSEVATAAAPAGTAETVDLDAIPGVNVAGSAVSGIVFPRSVAQSQAPNLTTPAILFVWDRRPPRCATVSPCYH